MVRLIRKLLALAVLWPAFLTVLPRRWRVGLMRTAMRVAPLDARRRQTAVALLALLDKRREGTARP